MFSKPGTGVIGVALDLGGQLDQRIGSVPMRFVTELMKEFNSDQMAIGIALPIQKVGLKQHSPSIFDHWPGAKAGDGG